ncbi:MAG: serine hydrolase domain-containing protein [Pseudomonadota bacterium]
MTFSHAKKILLLLSSVILTAHAASPRHFPAGTKEVYIATQTGVRSDLLHNIAPIVESSIAAGEYPGAVILVTHRGKIIYRGVFGNRRIMPSVAAMHFNTLFDIASLTKVVATAPAIMQLVEESKLDLDAPVAHYWPAFAQNGKSAITVRELLTHTSGLEPDLPTEDNQVLGATEIYKQIENLKPKFPIGNVFVYSDINFIALGYLVERITHESLPLYTQQHIFKLIGMKDTTYLPAEKLQDRIAPTEVIRDKLRWGEVFDPTTYSMNGVSGAAGVFSDAGDINLYLQCLLNGGRAASGAKNKNMNYILGPLTILKMTTPQTRPELVEVRGLGWDIDSPYANRGVLFPINSFGHTGYTGTSVWVDPVTQTSIIILTSRTHPKPALFNKLINDRREIANIVAASITDVKTAMQSNTGAGELSRAYRLPGSISTHKDNHS